MAFLDTLQELLPFGKESKAITPARDVKPPTDKGPAGRSGRVNFGGFIQFDELNAKLAGTLGLRVFDEMYREDPDIRRNTAAIWTPIQSANWSIEAFGGDEASDDDRRAAELCYWAVFNHMDPNWIAHIATLGPILIRSGFCPFEQIWMTETWKGKQVVVPRKLDLRLPRTIWRWFQDENGDLEAIEQFLPNAANVRIESSELTYYRLQAEGDNWTGTSLLRQAYKPWFYKSHFERIDAIGQERKAVGVPIVYPPQSAPKETREEVEEILANLHVNEVGYIMSPGPKAGTSGTDASEGWTFEVITFDSSSGETIQSSISMQKQAIASAFLADFLELGHHQVGARATAQVQEDPFLTAVSALATEIKQPGDALLERIAALNVPGLKGYPKFKFALSDAASLSEISTYASALIAAGAMQVDPELEDYFRERADFPPANPERRAEAERSRQIAKEAQEKALLNPEGGEGVIPPPAPGSFKTDKGSKPGGSPPTQPGTPGGPATPAGSPPKRTLHEIVKDQIDADGKRVLDGIDAVPSPDKGKITMPLHGQDNPIAGLEMLPDEVPTPGDEPVEVSGPWWEQMLSQGRLVEALDGVRDDMQKAALPATVALARMQTQRGKSGRTLSMNPPNALVAALRDDIHRLHRIGYETVEDEMAGQRAKLGISPAEKKVAAAALAALLLRARKRARISAQAVVAEVNRAVERAVTNGSPGEAQIQRAAEAAALVALRREAIANSSESLNEGRRAAAQAEGATGGIYTAVLDNTTCDNCEIADDGIIREPGDPALETPNPICDGGERCRCFVVWVLTNNTELLGA